VAAPLAASALLALSVALAVSEPGWRLRDRAGDGATSGQEVTGRAISIRR
jgi:hypothetical protein